MSLRAQLELQRQSYRKSARILTLSPSADPNLEGPSRKGSPSPDKPLASSITATSQLTQQQDSVQHVTMLSNMGAVQHAQCKHHTSALCYAQALQRCAHPSDKVSQMLRLVLSCCWHCNCRVCPSECAVCRYMGSLQRGCGPAFRICKC